MRDGGGFGCADIRVRTVEYTAAPLAAVMRRGEHDAASTRGRETLTRSLSSDATLQRCDSARHRRITRCRCFSALLLYSPVLLYHSTAPTLLLYHSHEHPPARRLARSHGTAAISPSVRNLSRNLSSAVHRPLPSHPPLPSSPLPSLPPSVPPSPAVRLTTHAHRAVTAPPKSHQHQHHHPPRPHPIHRAPHAPKTPLPRLPLSGLAPGTRAARPAPVARHTGQWEGRRVQTSSLLAREE